MIGGSERFLIRSRGTVLVDVELVPGAYMIGRGVECALHVAHAFVSRRHGSLWHEPGQGWRYRDLREEGAEPVTITDDAPVALGAYLDLVTGGYLVSHETLLRARPRKRRPWLWTSLVMALVMALGGGLFAHRRATAPLAPAELLARARGSVVSLEHAPSDETRAALLEATDLTEQDFLDAAPFCSGFVVAPDVVLTANHCVQAADGHVSTDFVVTADDGTRHPVARVLGYNVKRDYLFLEVPSLDANSPFELREEFVVGERVFTLGNVEGQGLALRDGIAASITPDRDRPSVDFLRFSAPASGGNSGGPLLDERGRVLGLVFARNRTETYNLATASRYLEDGRERWVESRDGSQVPVAARDFTSLQVTRTLERLGYPLVGDWYRHPELARPFEDLQYTQRVPVSLDELSSEVNATLDATIRPTYEGALATLREDGLMRWEDMVDDEHPVVFALGGRSLSIAQRDGRVVANALAVCVPPRTSGRSETVRIADCHSRRLQSERSDEAEVYRLGYVSSRLTVGRGLLGSMGRGAHFAEVRHAATAAPDTDALIARLVGDERPLFDASSVQYLRPRARRALTLDALPTEDTSEHTVRDGRGRSWEWLQVPVFDQGSFVVVCKTLPGGHLCDGTFLTERDDSVLERYVQNRARYSDADRVLAPLFLPAEAMSDWTAADDFALPTDFGFDAEAGVIRLGTLGVEVRLEQSPEAVRVHRALTRVDGQVRWFASGVDLVFATAGERVLCNTTLRAPLPLQLSAQRWRHDHYSAPAERVGAVTVGDTDDAWELYQGCARLDSSGERALRPSWRPIAENPPASAHVLAHGVDAP